MSCLPRDRFGLQARSQCMTFSGNNRFFREMTCPKDVQICAPFWTGSCATLRSLFFCLTIRLVFLCTLTSLRRFTTVCKFAHPFSLVLKRCGRGLSSIRFPHKGCATLRTFVFAGSKGKRGEHLHAGLFVFLSSAEA